jgi:hypothetical protein
MSSGTKINAKEFASDSLDADIGFSGVQDVQREGSDQSWTDFYRPEEQEIGLL